VDIESLGRTASSRRAARRSSW